MNCIENQNSLKGYWKQLFKFKESTSIYLL